MSFYLKDEPAAAPATAPVATPVATPAAVSISSDGDGDEPSTESLFYTTISGACYPFGHAQVTRLLEPFVPPGTTADYLDDEVVNIALDVFRAASSGGARKRTYIMSSHFYSKLMTWWVSLSMCATPTFVALFPSSPPC